MEASKIQAADPRHRHQEDTQLVVSSMGMEIDNSAAEVGVAYGTDAAKCAVAVALVIVVSDPVCAMLWAFFLISQI